MFASTESIIIIWYIYLSIINCVWMHRCECVVISLSYKFQCILICTYTVNEVNLNLFLVWPRSLEWTVDGCKNGASKWTNYKNKTKSFICRFGWKDFPSYYKYIHSRAIFVLEKGGVLLLGTVLLLGHIRYVCRRSGVSPFWPATATSY